MDEGAPLDAEAADAPRYRNASLERAFRILECFDEQGRELHLHEVCARTGLNKATVFRFLAVLRRLGYVEKDPATDGYALGYRLLQLAHRVDEYAALRRLVHPELLRLAAEVNETVHFARLHRDKVVYCDKVDTAHSLRMQTAVGSAVDAHATGIGKAILAYRPAAEIVRLYPGGRLATHSPNTITGVEALLKVLAGVRSRGYALDDEEFELGLRCVAAPVFDTRGEAVFAVSVSGPTVRVTDAMLDAATRTVVRTARRIQAILYPTGMPEP
ncbi:MAG TPA: IclR family transcriptional regulator [Azospirillum sp.]